VGTLGGRQIQLHYPIHYFFEEPRCLNKPFSNSMLLASQCCQTRFGAFDSERLHNGFDNRSFQPNYFLLVATTTTPPSLPWFASAAPYLGATDVPLWPQVPIIVLNRTTHVITGSTVLRLSGAKVTSSSTFSGTTTGGSGATITYRHQAEIPQCPFQQAKRVLGFELHEHHLVGRQHSAEISVTDSFEMRLIALMHTRSGLSKAGILSNLNP